MKTDPSTRSTEILVIDDDAIMRDLIADWLEAAGYVVRKVVDCRTAQEELKRRPPALCISDMFMPGACGAEAIAALKKTHPGIPIIAVSGHFRSGQGLDADAAMAGGAARALAKPVKRSDLLKAVAELLGHASP